MVPKESQKWCAPKVPRAGKRARAHCGHYLFNFIAKQSTFWSSSTTARRCTKEYFADLSRSIMGWFIRTVRGWLYPERKRIIQRICVAFGSEAFELRFENHWNCCILGRKYIQWRIQVCVSRYERPGTANWSRMQTFRRHIWSELSKERRSMITKCVKRGQNCSRRGEGSTVGCILGKRRLTLQLWYTFRDRKR